MRFFFKLHGTIVFSSMTGEYASGVKKDLCVVLVHLGEIWTGVCNAAAGV